MTALQFDTLWFYEIDNAKEQFTLISVKSSMNNLRNKIVDIYIYYDGIEVFFIENNIFHNKQFRIYNIDIVCVLTVHICNICNNQDHNDVHSCEQVPQKYSNDRLHDQPDIDSDNQ